MMVDPMNDAYLGFDWPQIAGLVRANPNAAVRLFKLGGPDTSNLVHRISVAARSRGMDAWKNDDGEVFVGLCPESWSCTA